MKFKTALFAAFTVLLGAGLQAEPVVLMDDAIGLSKTSVFDDPAPPEFAYSPLDPKKSGVLPRFWADAPPQIPHRVDKFLPVNAEVNKCLGCHEDPESIGKKDKGAPTPMPESHYVKEADKFVTANRRYVCTLCHVPQAQVSALVDNTFQEDK